MAAPSSAYSGAATSLTESAARGGCKDPGVEERRRGHLVLLPAPLTSTFGPLSGLEGKRHREIGQFQANFFSLLLFYCPTLAAQLNSSPWHFQAVKIHTAAERRAGIKLVTHPHLRVTKLKLCLHTPKLARFKSIWTLPAIPSLQFKERGGCACFLSHPSGAEACPTLPAPAQGLIHQA